MRWTKELPTTPGWYWIKGSYKRSRPIIIYSTGERAIGERINCYLRHLARHYTHFSGPIPEPEAANEME